MAVFIMVRAASGNIFVIQDQIDRQFGGNAPIIRYTKQVSLLFLYDGDITGSLRI
jgi:hypothetical protein